MARSISKLLGGLGALLAEEVRCCEKHGEYHARHLSGGNSRQDFWTPCDKCDQEAMAEKLRLEQQEQRAQADRERLERKIGRACIPPRFADRTFEGYRAETDEQKRALRVCMAYAENFEENRKTGRNILMLGNVGTGKTHLAAAIGNQIIRQTKYSALYVMASSVIRHVKASFSKEAEHSEGDAYRTFAEPDLLILDEVGVQNATEFELTVMFEVINWRYEEMKPTMVLSNRSIEDLPRYLGDRVVDRLRENGGKLVVFDWKSERSNIKGDSND